jgi:hypothetical protein
MAALALTLDLDLDPLLSDQTRVAQVPYLLYLLVQPPLVPEALDLIVTHAVTLPLSRRINSDVRVSVSTANWQATD